jgi:cysteinyl-tRNA synthetase
VLNHYRDRHSPGEIIQFFILSSHYRSPLNYSDEQLKDANAALTRLYTALRDVKSVVDTVVEEVYKTRFEQAMDDDFNTPVAVAVLFDLARELNKANENNPEKAVELASSLKFLGGLLGILQADPDAFLKQVVSPALFENPHIIYSPTVTAESIPAQRIEQQIHARLDAKKAKDWALADQIRDELKGQGVILEDKPDGTTSWRRE